MRHARQDDQREREGPFCSTMKAQDDNPLPRAVQSSTPARFAGRQWSTEPLPEPAVAAAASRAAIDATPVCRERARVREIEDGVCGAHRGNALDHSCRRRASRPCCLAKID